MTDSPVNTSIIILISHYHSYKYWPSCLCLRRLFLRSRDLNCGRAVHLTFNLSGFNSFYPQHAQQIILLLARLPFAVSCSPKYYIQINLGRYHSGASFWNSSYLRFTVVSRWKTNFLTDALSPDKPTFVLLHHSQMTFLDFLVLQKTFNLSGVLPCYALNWDKHEEF